MPTALKTATILLLCCFAAAVGFHLQGSQDEDLRTMMRLLDSPRNIHSFSSLALQNQFDRFAEATRNRNQKKWYDWGDGLAVDKKWYDWQDVPSVSAVSASNGKRDEKEMK